MMKGNFNISVFTGFIIAAFAGCLFSLPLLSQDVKVTTKTDTNAILIGSQFHLDLEVTHPPKLNFTWPVLPDTFSLLEIVSRSPIDTLATSPEGVTRKQQFVITSFDSGYHVIPPVTVRIQSGADSVTAESLPILITVSSIPVDTTKAIKDLKGQVAVPYTWRDFLPFIIAAIVIVLISWFVYRFLKNRKPKEKAPVIRIPEKPAWEIALEALAKLEEEKLWQQGLFKVYYTRLSDITRTFIEHMWALPAMEMTTDEIMRLQVIASQDQNTVSRLQKLLEFSDLVKFAKVVPISVECEQSMDQAIHFVNQQRSTAERRVETP